MLINIFIKAARFIKNCHNYIQSWHVEGAFEYVALKSCGHGIVIMKVTVPLSVFLV